MTGWRVREGCDGDLDVGRSMASSIGPPGPEIVVSSSWICGRLARWAAVSAAVLSRTVGIPSIEMFVFGGSSAKMAAS